MTKRLTLITIFSLFFLGVIVGMASLSRPKLVTAKAPLEVFSAERAMAHIYKIAFSFCSSMVLAYSCKAFTVSCVL